MNVEGTIISIQDGMHEIITGEITREKESAIKQELLMNVLETVLVYSKIWGIESFYCDS